MITPGNKRLGRVTICSSSRALAAGGAPLLISTEKDRFLDISGDSLNCLLSLFIYL